VWGPFREKQRPSLITIKVCAFAVVCWEGNFWVPDDTPTPHGRLRHDYLPMGRITLHSETVCRDVNISPVNKNETTLPCSNAGRKLALAQASSQPTHPTRLGQRHR
jgi:hypothetical protein